MDNSKCYFDKTPLSCSRLTVKNCESCTFKKTEKEFNEGVRHAQKILMAKGLVACEGYDPDRHRAIMTTRSIR